VELPAPDSKPAEPVGDPEAPEVQGGLETPPASPIGDPEAEPGEIREPEPQGEIQEAGTVIPFLGRKPEPNPKPDPKVVPLNAPQPTISEGDAKNVNYDPVSREQPVHPFMDKPECPTPDEAAKARIDAMTRMLKREINRNALPINKSASLPFVKGEGAKPPEPIRERPPVPAAPKNPRTTYHPDPMVRRIINELDDNDWIVRETFGATQAQIDEGRRLLKEYQEAMATLAERRAKWREEWGR
jgi:hypothetical protein